MASIITVYPIDRINSAKHDILISTRERNSAFSKYTRYASKTEGIDKDKLAKLKENYEIKKFNLESRKETLSRVLAHEAEQPLDVLRSEISRKATKMFQLRGILSAPENERNMKPSHFADGYLDAYTTLGLIIGGVVDSLSSTLAEGSYKYSRNLLQGVLQGLLNHGTATLNLKDKETYGEYFYDYSRGYEEGIQAATDLVLSLHTELTRYDDKDRDALKDASSDPSKFQQINLSVWGE